MNSLWPSRASNDTPVSGKPVVDVADTGVTDVNADAAPRQTAAKPPSRPPLLRGQVSQPPPAAPPPPAVPLPPSQPAPSPGGGNGIPQQPPDSLSLAQLRRIVAEIPRAEPVAYDFVYEDMGTLDEEIDEWFAYQTWQLVRLDLAQTAFEFRWEQVGRGTSWRDADPEARARFLLDALEAISSSPNGKGRSTAIGAVLYTILGTWGESAGSPAAGAKRDAKARTVATQGQLGAMKAATLVLARLGGIAIMWEALRNAFEPFWAEDPQQIPTSVFQEAQDDLMNLMTIMYVIVQQALSEPIDMAICHTKLLELDPTLTDFMMNATAKLRWDDGCVIPQCQVFLLLWKSILVVFGGTQDLAETKKATSERIEDDKEKDLITASPLDYHVFRQEITSKYPAYIPPQPAIPLEAEHASLLPPLPNSTRNNGANGILPGPSNAQAGGASILHQPVHIATPAPSPPPSPGVGGKGGKKQNYQTNQNFPFMYPPLDATSNGAGGKGPAGWQDFLVGRKWEGSDVPASILEAGELFSKRVRMTRATRQLWQEREKFLKFERGWDAADDDIVDELDLSSLTIEEKEELGLTKPKETKTPELEVDYGPRPDEVGDRIRQRLDMLEAFYRESLPQLQSLVIVLLKTILNNVAVLMSQMPTGQQHPGVAGPNNARMNGAANGASGTPNGDGVEMTPDELDAARTREIGAKAVSGIILLLLKWFKVSHVLKFEYVTQLLLDCNYIPLLLKLWAHQDVQQLVDSKTDRTENSFFYFCNVRAGSPEGIPAGPVVEVVGGTEEPESDDEAAPPPIKRQRSPPQRPAQSSAGAASQDSQDPNAGTAAGRPEVDELGYPVNPLPKEPITDFSRRNFFSLINLLRVMQKMCKNKAHRNLLLVHYKSSNILRKMLKVPQPELRLYTLKLFKNQVPYCGRKWRQGNMRVITAVYLHCRPELRDEWLSGSDVDAEVEEALPLEQALRSLTHWFNVRRYPDRMAAEVRSAMREEQDFFVRELEKIDLHWGEAGDGESVVSEWEGMPG